MSRRGLTRSAPGGTRALVDRLLDRQDLVATVQSLEPRLLGKLIAHVGLEDCGELVALATTEQLRHVFDEDLWTSAGPGLDPSFDPRRFALWLEIMLEAGEDAAAAQLVELPEDLVVLALHGLALVVDASVVALQVADLDKAEADVFEKVLDGSAYLELGSYQVIARREDGWDALVTVLLALDRSHHEALERLLVRCCAASEETIDDGGGLCEVLTSEEMLAVDAGADRDDRRSEAGYVAQTDASVFLAVARRTSLPELLAGLPADPIDRACRRPTAPAPSRAMDGSTRRRATHGESPRDQAATGEPPHGQGAPLAPPDAPPLVDLLRDAGLLQDSPVLLPGRAADEPLLRRAMAVLSDAASPAEPRVLEELATLANVLVAAGHQDGQGLRPLDAARVAVAVCSVGLELLLGDPASPEDAAAALERRTAVEVFRFGWRLLHERVALPACAAVARLAAASPLEPRAAALERAAHQAASSARPWTLRPRLALLALPPGTHRALAALLDECPSVDGAPLDSLRAVERANALLESL